MLTSLRHQQAIAAALAALADAAQANAASIPHEMILLDLYRALWALDSLTGQTTPDDILNLIFSTFCIGNHSGGRSRKLVAPPQQRLRTATIFGRSNGLHRLRTYAPQAIAVVLRQLLMQPEASQV
jgi:hypothetical protein